MNESGTSNDIVHRLCMELIVAIERRFLCHFTNKKLFTKKKLSEKVTRFTKIEKVRKGNGLK